MIFNKPILFRLLAFTAISLSFSAVSVLADPFCFSRAQSYYEQVYCELQSRAQLQGLPGFEEFKNNSEPVQYSLLKRPAERNRIKLPPAKTSTPKTPQVEVLPPKPQVPHQAARPNIQHAQSLAVAANDDCRLTGKEIRCGDKLFQAQGNLRNSRLASDVLESENRMAIPERTGSQSEADYLLTAYVQYLNKMREIGLGGVTMTYGKFAFLYHDLGERGLNFVQRFETMYGFLKKDKATLGVSEGVVLPEGLSWQDCAQVSEEMLVCGFQGRNYLFVGE